MTRGIAADARHYSDYARLVADLGTGDPPPTPEAWLEHIAPELVVHEEDGRVVALGRLQIHGADAYVRFLVVAAERRGRGLGRAMLHELADRARQQGACRWRLNVKPDNAPALRLYQALGLRETHRLWALRLACHARFPLAGGPHDQPDLARGTLARRAAAPEEDARLEQHFDLLPGQLAHHRRRPGCAVFVHERSGAPVALAAYDPAYSGVFPLRVPDPGDALPVAASLRPLAVPGRGHLQMVLERDTASAERLLDAGAVLHFEALHLVGSL